VKRLFLPLLLTAAVALPLPAVKKDTQMMLAEIQKVADQLTASDQRLTQAIADLTKKVEIIEERVAAMARGQADLQQGRESAQVSLQFFKEELTEIKNSISRLGDRLMTASSGTAPAAVPSSSANPAKETESRPAAGSGVAALSGDPNSAYYAAYSDYLKENYAIAIEGFRQFIRSFPDSGLADNSLYWIGECAYAQKKYQEAVVNFNELISRYHDGDKVPAAMLKRAYALAEMGRQAEAAAGLKELISRFPLAEESKLAKQKLQELND